MLIHKQNKQLNIYKTVFHTLMMIITISLLSFCSLKAKLPEIKKPSIKKIIKNYNQLHKNNVILRIPESWNYLITEKDKSFANFENPDRRVFGTVNIYPNKGQKDFKLVFQEYLKEKSNIAYQWMNPVNDGKSDAWMAKGKVEVIENVALQKIKYYQVYLALFQDAKHLYEIIILVDGEKLDVLKEIISIFRSFDLSDPSKTIVWQRFGLSIPHSENWIIQSGKERQIISWKHNKEPITLSLSLVGKLKGKSSKKSLISKDMNEFKMTLMEINYKFDFDIRKEPVTKKKLKSRVLNIVGTINDKRLGVRKYYFSYKNYLYSALIWYDSKDWKGGIGDEVYKVLNSIEFIK
ncbi:MAG: hypothetical protein OEZ36_04800 [Spirochaetota bacterium]|nr:hypothetical protein [Spirochaetota bacterium]